MKAAARALIALSVLNAIVGASSCPPPPKPGDPLRGLAAGELDRFRKGQEVFERTFTAETGLGPLFNADACGECHEDPVLGAAGDEVELHVAALRPDGFCDPLADSGGPVIQQKVTPALEQALGIDREPVPATATGRASRSTPSVLGFGLLDAVPDREILSRADPRDRDHDGISGRPNRFFDGRLGRFGRKALVPTLREFNAGAFTIEMGITTPATPAEETVAGRPLPAGVDPTPEPELSEEDLGLADDFVRFSAPPLPLPLDHEGERGKLVFGSIGCASCHTPSLSTGQNKVRALSYKRVDAYTDLLLHDMGPERADICLGLAQPSEFRTEPLMGLRLKKTFMHDAAATTVEEAIELHGGEATAARNKFRRLGPRERSALLEFLSAL
ncbi:MAG TPA: di-heme oxidoredictase family protein [Candidatus Eisenbacteria bacterium]|jgi:CxxC motif-containing protein (DUF1111 family)